MELQVLQQSIPVVEFNKEELKVFLEQQLEKYKQLVVTVDTEKDCKKAKAELTKLETAIETFRKDTKKQLSEPIANFESDCKELVALIQEVKKPIDIQLKEIEEQRKAEKEDLIREEIAKIVIDYELDEKHSSQLDILASYLNKSTSMNKIITDLKNRAETLKIAQMSVVKNQELIKMTCEVYNPRLKTPLDPSAWSELLAAGNDINAIVTKIHDEGKKRLVEEIEAEEKEAREILNQPEEAPVVHKEPTKQIYTPGPNAEIKTATVRLFGDDAQFKAFKSIMASIGMKYQVVQL